MNEELAEGIEEGRYIWLERGWAVTTRWAGPLVAFRSLDDRFGLLVKSRANVWRCYLGFLEGNGMHGVEWWESRHEVIVGGFAEGFAMIESFLLASDW